LLVHARAHQLGRLWFVCVSLSHIHYQKRPPPFLEENLEDFLQDLVSVFLQEVLEEILQENFKNFLQDLN